MLPDLFSPVFANAGTPLMWFTAFHLLAGNALIGILEGCVLIKWFKARPGTAIILMILANYLSAWLGMWLVHWLAGSADMDITNLHRWFWIMAGITYGATLLIEWPVVAACLMTWKRGLRASFVVQTVSYVLMFGLHSLVTGATRLQGIETVPAGDLPLPASVEVYYIGKDDGNVYRMRSSESRPEMIHELKSGNSQDRLLWDEAEPGRGNLLVRFEEVKTGSHLVTIRKDLPGHAVDDQQIDKNTWANHGKVESLSQEGSGKWTFSTGFWAAQGLRGDPAGETPGATRDRKKSIQLALETPFVSWEVRNAVLLPGDKVLFQFGKNQICLFDPGTMRLALLCRGRGPVAVMVPGPLKEKP